ncbi:MAG TPA: O-antigen ligase family protein [Vicinamibacteria bacterium]|nr:O-antigen ligase family protein [Vicinamibacteria bacterium]
MPPADAQARQERFRRLLRAPLVAMAFAAPLAMGAVHEAVFVPLLALAWLIGLLSWGRAQWARAMGTESPPVPGTRLLAALHALVLLQLLPLPPAILKTVSPGSFAFYDRVSLVPLTEWRPISVNPADSARGLAFLFGMSLLFAAAFRELAHERWRRRLCGTVVAAAFVMTLAALVQASSAHPTRIWGLWQPRWDWGVFGPYVSKNHFAGYMAMAIPLGIAFAAEAFLRLRQAWAGRRRGWVALGGPDGNATIRLSAVAMVLVVGLLASRSRGGLLAGAAAVGVLPLALPRQRARALALVALIALAGIAWMDLTATRAAFATRGVQSSRLDLWSDALRMFPDFPILGAGFNAFGTAYIPYQAVARYEWYGEAHNEYLQALLDTGVVGGTLVLGLVAVLLRRAWAAAAQGPLEAGLLGAVTACLVHNVVDFNWQIPANAATFAMLAGLAVQRRAEATVARADLDPHRSAA